jgi:hypothetical protein
MGVKGLAVDQFSYGLYSIRLLLGYGWQIVLTGFYFAVTYPLLACESNPC